MERCYRLVYQSFNKNEPDKTITQQTLLEDTLNIPTNCFDIGMGFENEIKLIQLAQDKVINEQMELLPQKLCNCPNCKKKLAKFGKQKTTFHDVLTDHILKIQRFKCGGCGYETPSTMKTIFNTIQSGFLKKIQSTLGANFPYRESEKILDLFSTKKRYINNHDRIKHVTEAVGNEVVKLNKDEKEIITAKESKNLVLNVDGGHVKTLEDKRSMEAMTSVVYNPTAIRSNKKDTRNHLVSKNCAASVKEDNQEQIISGTIVAALKQGMTDKTHVTALCDGADNCWKVAESLQPLCSSMTYILDWFHLTMKIKNISLPERLKLKLTRIKWHLWRGNTDRALIRLDQLITAASQEKHIERIYKFANYIRNNKGRIVNYRERKKTGLVFTSNLAESTVESLINRRCKGHQHMRWSREGLNPVLQLRAAICSGGDWESKVRDAILNAA